MRIVCTKSNLVKGVSIVSKAVPSKTTMPILECILVDASTDVIKLTANDMELGIETRIEGDILERGIIALNAKIFSEIVRKLPDSDVVIETTSDNQTLITCEKAKFNIAKTVRRRFFISSCNRERRLHYCLRIHIKRSDSSDNFLHRR